MGCRNQYFTSDVFSSFIILFSISIVLTSSNRRRLLGIYFYRFDVTKDIHYCYSLSTHSRHPVLSKQV